MGYFTECRGLGVKVDTYGQRGVEMGREDDHLQGIFRVSYDLLVEEGRPAEWVSYDHPMHGYIFPVRGADGAYAVALTITDSTGPVTQVVKVRVDRGAPKLTRVPGRLLRLSLGEPARVTFIADGTPITVRRPKAGVFRVVIRAKRLTAYAEDDAGNRSKRLTLR